MVSDRRGPAIGTIRTETTASQALMGNYHLGKEIFVESKGSPTLSHAAVSMVHYSNTEKDNLSAEHAKSLSSSHLHSLGVKEGDTSSTLLDEMLQLVPPCHSPARILVAEDNAMARLCLSNLLDKWGASFVLCKDGKEAWHQLNQQAFDLALIDLQMPYMDGPKLVEILRQAPYNANSEIPVVALTGSSDPRLRSELAELGVNDCLLKPFEMGEFYRVVRQYTTLHAPQPIHFFSDSFDDQVLLQLYDNDYEHISYMFSLFLTNTPKSVASIQEAAQADRWDEVQREVHKIKPTFAMVGLREIGKLANRLEQKLRPQSLGRDIMTELESFCQKVDDAIHAVASEQRLLTNYLK